MKELFDRLLPDSKDEKTYTNEELIQHVANIVSELLEREPDLLFSTLYRMDIDEQKIKKALLASTEGPDIELAKLILDRQKKRMESKRKYSSESSDFWK